MQTLYDATAKRWLNLFSMERSGHVAFLNWMMHQAPQPCVRVTPSASPKGEPGHGYYYPGAPLVNNKPISTVPPAEDVQLAVINFRDKGILSPKGYPRAKESVILIRDIRNLLASRMRHFEQWDLRGTAKMWMRYACAYTGDTSLTGTPLVPVRYDRWFLEKEYRQSLVDTFQAAFNIPFRFTDEGINHVPVAGKGSSFDGRKFDGRPQEMKVLERYKMVNQKILYSLIPREARELDEHIFGPWEK